MRKVIVESPFAGDVEANLAYARRCLLDSLHRGEAPFASHLLYPQVLRDADKDERAQGISAGLEWAVSADITAVYMDYGISLGMEFGIMHAIKHGRQIEYREIGR